MADLSDVENALVQAISVALYPNGIGSASLDINGLGVRVFRGWPVEEQLKDDLNAQKTTISVFPKPGVSTNTTRYIPRWEDAPAKPSTMSVALSHNATGSDIATFSGIGSDGMCVGIRRMGRPYSAQMHAGDGPELAAARLAALVPTAVAMGPAVMCPRSAGLAARVAMPRISRRELRRVKQAVTVSVWSPSPEDRDAVASRVDSILGSIDWLPLADGTGGRIQFISQAVIDTTENSGAYRRDTELSVEYALYDQRLLPVMMFGIIAGQRPDFSTVV